MADKRKAIALLLERNCELSTDKKLSVVDIARVVGVGVNLVYEVRRNHLA